MLRQFRIQTEGAIAMVAQPPQKKIADRDNQIQAAHWESGELLMTVDLLYIEPGEKPDVLTVTVPESGIAPDMPMGTQVALTGFVARPWENEFETKGGKKRKMHGIGLTAVAVTAIDVPAAKSKAA
jgi:hypothetical protein